MKRLMPALALCAVLTLSGCVADEQAAMAGAARQTLASLDGLNADEQLAVVSELAAITEQNARDAWGVSDALGGTASATAVFGRLSEPTETYVADHRASPPTITLASTTGASANFGQAIGSTVAMIGIWANSGIDGSNDGTIGSERTEVPGGSVGIDASIDGSVTVDYSTSGKESTSELSMSAKANLGVCPDADGEVHLSATVKTAMSVGPIGGTVELHVTVTGYVDDDAKLTGKHYTYRQQFARHSGATGEYLDHSGTSAGELTINRNSADATVPFAQAAAQMAAGLSEFIANDLLTAAEKGWMSGRCITLTADPSEDPTQLDPSAELLLTAEPRSRYDAQPTGGTVTATLAGEGSLDPAGSQVPADASYTYTAASEQNKSGTITFESRSKRGVGKLELAVSTGAPAYTALGSRDEFTGRGTICSLTSKFVITGNHLTFTFTPEDRYGGTYTAAGALETLTFRGDGTYRVDYENYTARATTLRADGTMTVIGPDGSTYDSEGDIDFALTPAPPCS